jgi:hypothetical protein
MDDVNFLSLWLPILLSSVAVFVASFLAWVVSPHHKPDWKGIPNEDGFLEALRANNTPPGQYMFPYCAAYSELKDPEKKKRYAAGPHGTLTVWPGMPNQTPKMVASFIFYLVVGVFVAYVAAGAAGLKADAEYLEVFRVTGTVAVMAYCLGFIPGAIWFGRSMRSVAMDVVDGVVYALLTAGFFGWLWPAAGG